MKKDIGEEKHKIGGINSFQYAFKKITKMKDKYPYLFWGLIAGSVIGGLLFAGYLNCNNLKSSMRLSDITLFTCVRYSLEDPVMALVFVVLLLGLSWYAINRFYHPASIDEERNLQISDSGVSGTDHPMTDEEIEKYFVVHDTFEPTDFILGAHPRYPDKVLSRRFNIFEGGNGNQLYCGIPGCMKSRSMAAPFIYQAIRAGVSVIVSDPKLELYRKTSKTARAHGVHVKCLNFKKDSMLHSDSCNYMANVGTDATRALSFSHTLIMCATSMDDIRDFWVEGADNLLSAAILYVNDDELNAGEYDKTLTGVFDLINKNDLKSLTSKFNAAVQNNRPAGKAWLIFNKPKEEIQTSTMNSLLNKLRLFIDNVVGKLVSVDDIDMELPGREPCIYYLGFSDTDSSFEMFSSLYFNLQFQVLYDYADSFVNGALPVKTVFLLDEIRSIGIIPDFVKKLSTCRGRNIDIIAIVQSLAMLEDMYGPSWEQVFECFDIKVCLKTASVKTAEYFSDLTGSMTALDESRRVMGSAGEFFDHGSGTIQRTFQNKERNVYLPGEILHMKANEMLVILGAAQCTKMKKIDYEIYPMFDETMESPIEENYPLWARKLSMAERKMCNITDTTYYEAVRAIKEDAQIVRLPLEAYQVSYIDRKRIHRKRMIKKFGLEAVDPQAAAKKKKNNAS